MSARAALYAAAHGALILDATRRLTSCTTATTMRGFAESQATLADSNLDEQLRIAAQSSMAIFAVGDGQGFDYAGRLEDVPIGGSQLQLRAFGYARAMDDIPYTALWSETRVSTWRPVLLSERTDAYNDRYEFNTINQLWITCRKGETVGTTTVNKVGRLAFFAPDQGTRSIVNIAFDYTFSSQTNWACGLQSFDDSWGSTTSLWALAGTGAAVSGSECQVLGTQRNRLSFYLFYNAADAVNGGNTGDAHLKITNVRITTIALAVDTTLTNAPIAGATSMTVASATNITVGMTLYLGGTNPERVTVTSVAGTTIGISALVNAKAIGNTARAQRVLPSDIVSHCVSLTNATNSAQIVAPTSRIQTGDIDLVTELWEDARMSDVLTRMASYGDTSKNPWGWWVDRDKVLVFERRGLGGYTFYVDVTPDQLEIIRSTADVYNSAYAIYQEAAGRTLRTSATTDAPGVARYGVTRRAAVPAQTTNVTQAGQIRDTFLQDRKTPQPKIRLTVTRLYDAGGNDVPLSAPNAGRGDTIVIRNLSPVLPGDASQLRSFRLGYSSVDWLAGTVTLESENPPAGIAAPTLALLPHQASLAVSPLPAASTTSSPRQQLPGRGGRLPGRGDTLDW